MTLTSQVQTITDAQGNVTGVIVPIELWRELAPPKETEQRPRPIGLAAGEFSVPDDFDALLPDEILAEFEGR